MVKFFEQHIKLSLVLGGFLLAIILLLVANDYYDKGLFPGWGFLTKTTKSSPFEGFAILFSSLALIASFLAYRESHRQTEISLRPYLRVAWNSSLVKIDQDRYEQGIVDTCIQFINEGRGLMRNVYYEIYIDEKLIPVRNHSLISPSGATTVVYSKTTDDMPNLTPLGVRNSLLQSFPQPIMHEASITLEKHHDNLKEERIEKNNSRIKLINNSNQKIIISGKYQDVENRTYKFKFESDPKEQSWFGEKDVQKRIN